MLIVRSINLRRKHLPGTITWHIQFKEPMIDCNLFRGIDFLCKARLILTLISEILSKGILYVMSPVDTVKPKTTASVLGVVFL